MQQRVAIAGLWSRFFFYLCAFSLKGRCSSESMNAESLSCIRMHTHIHTPCMHAKPCLIYKAKLSVTPAVPAADCCHASLPSLLQAQTMTTQARSIRTGLAQSWGTVSYNCLRACCFAAVGFIILAVAEILQMTRKKKKNVAHIEI